MAWQPDGRCDISSANGNTLAAASLTTDDTGGQAQVDVTASAAGLDTISADALGLTATTDLNVSNDSFALTAPVAGDEIVLGAVANVQLTWTIGRCHRRTVETITFSATRGNVERVSGNDGRWRCFGDDISRTTLGRPIITATNAAGTSDVSVEVEFVADHAGVNRRAGQSVHDRTGRAECHHRGRTRCSQ